ncbi:MAG: hypothetical protein ACW99J_18855 [Candidatus Thorarchaeota archaeon]|jgi:hypothetical protein
MAKKRGRGFKKIKRPLDRGYERPRKDGGRDHKRSPAGRYHVDKVHPGRNPVGHVVRDVALRRRKRK